MFLLLLLCWTRIEKFEIQSMKTSTVMKVPVEVRGEKVLGTERTNHLQFIVLEFVVLPGLLDALAARPLPEDLPASPVEKGRDTSKGQGDAFAVERALVGVLLGVRPSVRPNGVVPFAIRLPTQDKERIVRQFHFFSPARLSFVHQGHRSRCPETEVDDLGVQENVQSLVRVLGNVVLARLVALNQGVIDLLPEHFFDAILDDLRCRCPREQFGLFVGRMPIEGFVVIVVGLHGDRSLDTQLSGNTFALLAHRVPADLFAEFVEKFNSRNESFEPELVAALAIVEMMK